MSDTTGTASTSTSRLEIRDRPYLTPSVSFSIPPDPSERTTAQDDDRPLPTANVEYERSEGKGISEQEGAGVGSPNSTAGDPEKEEQELSETSSPPTPRTAVSDEETPQRPPLGSRLTTGGVSKLSRGSHYVPLKRHQTRLAQKEAHPWQHLGITLGGPMIILFDLVVPCIIYYTWYNKHTAQWHHDCRAQFPDQSPCPLVHEQFDKAILGSAIASFGVGELWILLARIYRLFFRREDCAPLLSRNRWELDATSWVYLVAMVVALIPFVVGSTLVIPELYLYGPSVLMAFLGLLMVATFIPIPLPVGINSQPRGGHLRPFIYYAAEDFVAVDGLQDREFRVRFNERYESSAMFRNFFRMLTLWWMLGVAIYIGGASAIIWNLEFHYAFGATFGLLFSYIAIWAGVTIAWVKWEMEREKRAFEKAVLAAENGDLFQRP